MDFYDRTVDGEPYLREKRVAQGLTMKQLANRCTDAGVSVSVSEISRVERRIHTPGPPLAKVLAELLGVTVAEVRHGPPL